MQALYFQQMEQKIKLNVLLISSTLLISGCAGIPPRQLLNAA